MARIGRQQRRHQRRGRRLALRAGHADRRRRTEPQEQVRLGHERRRAGRRRARVDERTERRPQARLGRRVVGRDRRRRRHERGIGPRRRRVDRPDRAPGVIGRPPRPSIAAVSSLAVAPVVDRHRGARRRRGTGQAPGRCGPGRARSPAGRAGRRHGSTSRSRASRSIGRAGRCHRRHCSRSRDARKSVTPSSAARIPRIQKRIVIFSSSQPPSSKWWWIGLIRNRR